MLVRISGLGIRFPKLVLAAAAGLLVLAALVGASIFGHLSAGGFDDPASNSSQATAVLADRFHTGNPNLVLEVEGAGGTDGAAPRAEGTRIVQALRQQPGVSGVSSYWTAPPWIAPSLRSQDGRRALVIGTVAGDDNEAPRRAADLAAAVTATGTPGVTVRVGGQAPAYHEATTRISDDLLVAEAVAVPLTGLGLVLVFGSVLAALVPLAVGLVAMFGTLAVLRGLTALTEVSIYAVNLTTALGLALAIDYSLLIVSRYREQVRAGADRPDALRASIATAGRTVVFSALTVALSLAALLVFPMSLLRSFGFAGIAVVVLAALAALVVLPAMLTLLGDRVDALDVRRPVRRLFRRPAAGTEVRQSRWYRLAMAVMRRPVVIGLGVTAGLLVLAAPFLGVRFGYPDDRILPPASSSHVVGDSLRGGYASDASGTLTVVLPDGTTGLADYATRLSTVDGVTGVSAATGTYQHGRVVAPGDPRMSLPDSTYLVVRSDREPMSDAGRQVLTGVRAVPAPGRALVAGLVAENADSVTGIGQRLPWALGWIALATFVVLFLFTGSVLLPVKALVLNVLSLSATFGAMAWVFQDGHLLSLYGSTSSGYLVATMPVLMFCLAFGTSMDYEVFLLARIREHWLQTAQADAADNQHAVGLGLASTGRIVTAAAVLMAIVFAAIATSSVSMMQMFGTGLGIAVLVDATVVRCLLLPAFMRLMGRANWWAPRPLARWHARHGWREAVPAT